MAKDPVLPLYYNDISGSTQTWSDEEFGAYVRLLIHQWRDGGLPTDYQRLTRISTSLDRNWSMLKAKFPEVDGLLKNPVMEEIRAKRAVHKQKQKENVQKRYQKSTKQDTKNLPLENEIENEKEVLLNKIEPMSKLEVFDALFTDHRFLDDMQITHKGKDIQQAFEECYIHHINTDRPPQDLNEWRRKLNTWLTIKSKDTPNGTGKISKRDAETISRREAFAKRHSSGAGEQ